MGEEPLMVRFAAVVSYKGKDFFGYQYQPGKRTVQGVFEEALKMIHKNDIKSEGAGRTDTGVHAYGQVIAFNSDKDRLSEKIMKDALNAYLPDDLYVRRVHLVKNNFSPRYLAKKRIYHYYVFNNDEPNMIFKDYSWWFPYSLDLGSMRKASVYLLGEKDFSSFKTGKDDRSPIRTIQSIRILSLRKNLILFRIEGISFLRRMVRNIVGTLIKIGTHAFEPDEMNNFVQAKNRSVLPGTAPGNGLFLYKIVFDEFET